MADYQSCIKLFARIFEKLVSSHHFTASQAGNAKAQFSKFLQTVVGKNLASFHDYNLHETRSKYFFLSILKAIHISLI